MAKAPQRNPFGTEEEPAKFMDFDVFTKASTPSWSKGSPNGIILYWKIDTGLTTAHTMDNGKP
jgi:hypothetical protein